MNDATLRKVRRFLSLWFLKLAVGLAAFFILARVVTPALINAHDDTLGALGLLSAFAAPVLLGWLAVSLFISGRRFIGQIGDSE